jgi:type IV secretory pathway TrbF-like protein
MEIGFTRRLSKPPATQETNSMSDNSKSAVETESNPQPVRRARYYEHDGALRAYANRAMVLAFLSLPTTLIAVAMAAYVRLQPPLVFRVDGSGAAQAFERNAVAAVRPAAVSQSGNAEAGDFEKKAYVRLFLDRYLNFSPATVNQNWAESLNMMTANLRRGALSAMEKNNAVGNIADEQITSVFHLRSLEPAKDDGQCFTVFGIKEVHRVRDHQESSDKLVGEFRLRLITERRSEQNPSGLLVAEYAERLIEAEKRDAVAASVSLTGER